MKDDARAAAELEALRAEFAAYRTEAEAKIAELERENKHLNECLDDSHPEPPLLVVPAKKPRKPRPTKGK